MKKDIHMKKITLLIVLISLIVSSSVSNAGDMKVSDKKATPTLAPGGLFSIEFPEMPPTFFSKYANGKDATPRMSVFLPKNYDQKKKFPLLVYLDGGNGGDASNPKVARDITQETDFICVAMPLFKTNHHNFIMRDEDGQFMWPHFRTMLDKLYELVPNIDPSYRILGGFSNGAHATQGLIDESDGEVARRFSAFFFVEGGGRLRQYDLLKGNSYLIVSSQPGSKPKAQVVCDAARAAGANATLIFHDVGHHDFTPPMYPKVNEWLRGTDPKSARE